ncbi:MAG: NIPSNAP family protein [Pseudomonadota bacterium]
MTGSHPISCHIRYVIDPNQVEAFGRCARAWIPIVERFGRTRLGYFLLLEGANKIAYALFPFGSLTEYEACRSAGMDDPECIAAFKIPKDTGCILSYERSFFRPSYDV